jgi:hypothetical protein
VDQNGNRDSVAYAGSTDQVTAFIDQPAHVRYVELADGPERSAKGGVSAVRVARSVDLLPSSAYSYRTK